ncbi:hypothetical protein TERTU_1218 [Teredinibacter turnerae T7901]|uniref:Uncharacterized protein n=1 Tax=Teredinibacter turnerae (strain ATCC 39867 / T7901) TaxID=377629 RepID=C5BRR3_TERTT|nr:hypothetical protein TERTU_1218 [Teredinibacter turnerae T7901]
MCCAQIIAKVSGVVADVTGTAHHIGGSSAKLIRGYAHGH